MTDKKITSIDENWLCRLNHSPNDWLQGADRWFLTGHLDPSYRIANNTLMKMQVPDFDRIVANGSFTVQIIGKKSRTNLAILGPSPAAQQVMVNIHNRTLYISQPKDLNLRHVIVRVGVGNLASLTQLGSGNIYGRGILSNCLSIYSSGTGNIMLVGNMNLQQINHLGRGTISIFGANTPALAINVIGNGCVNLCGQVGVQSIMNRGNGKIDILGMESPCLTIDAAGCGIIRAVGVANLKKITTRDNSQVYLTWVNSENLTIITRDQSRVGLAGTATNLTLDTKGISQFEGQYLFARSAFATTHNSSHANVNATQQLFLNAEDSSSIYYFSKVKQLSTLTYNEGIIIRTHSNPCACLIAPPIKIKRPFSYKGKQQIYRHSND